MPSQEDFEQPTSSEDLTATDDLIQFDHEDFPSSSPLSSGPRLFSSSPLLLSSQPSSQPETDSERESAPSRLQQCSNFVELPSHIPSLLATMDTVEPLSEKNILHSPLPIDQQNFDPSPSSMPPSSPPLLTSPPEQDVASSTLLFLSKGASHGQEHDYFAPSADRSLSETVGSQPGPDSTSILEESNEDILLFAQDSSDLPSDVMVSHMVCFCASQSRPADTSDLRITLFGCRIHLMAQANIYG